MILLGDRKGFVVSLKPVIGPRTLDTITVVRLSGDSVGPHGPNSLVDGDADDLRIITALIV